MRRRAGIVGMMALVVVLALTATLLVQVGRDGGLSPSRLVAELQDLGATAAAWVRGPGLPTTAGGLGAIVGWVAGSWQTRTRLRKRSLLLVDPRGPDMPFMEGIRHVRSHSGLSQGEPHDAGAAELLLSAARQGRISLWQQTTPDLARRVSPRQLRRIAAPGEPALPTEIELAKLAPFRLIRREIEGLWPAHITLQGFEGRALSVDP